MKRQLFSFTLPLSILSFSLVTQWSYGIVVDGTDEFFYGFPFVYKSPGFHTSLSSHYFLLEMVADFVCYFLFWFTVTTLVLKKWSMKIPRWAVRTFWIIFGVFFSLFVYLSHEFDDLYSFSRDFEMEIYDRGISIFGSHPDREQYLEEIFDAAN